IPLLFLSESAAPEMRLAGLRAGAVDYIAKPFEPAEVIERIDIHTRLASRRAPAMERVARDGAGHGDAKPGEAEAPQYEARKSARRGPYHHDDVLFSAIRRIVLEELEHPPSAAELAKSLGVSQHRLMSAIKAQTGASLFEFVRGKRMEKASRLLVRTGLSVTDVAAEVGYSS